MSRETDYAWAAGIVDGEGCIYISRNKAGSKNGNKTDTYVCCLKVTMGHEPTILRLRTLFGSGSKHKLEQAKEGRSWNDAYSWLVSSLLLTDVLNKIYPYLVTKKEEADLARVFLNKPHWKPAPGRAKPPHLQQQEYELWDRMRRLKPRTILKLAREQKDAKNLLHPQEIQCVLPGID